MSSKEAKTQKQKDRQNQYDRLSDGKPKKPILRNNWPKVEENQEPTND